MNFNLFLYKDLQEDISKEKVYSHNGLVLTTSRACLEAIFHWTWGRWQASDKKEDKQTVRTATDSQSS